MKKTGKILGVMVLLAGFLFISNKVYAQTECQWKASRISSGYFNTCAVTPSSEVKCWGYNAWGLLGIGDKSGDVCGTYPYQTCSNMPVDAVVIPDSIREMSVGQTSSCFITDTGGVKCWGYNSNGQLGDGTTTGSLAPVDVVGLSSGVVAISVSAFGFACVITDTGGVKCWGYNGGGEVGDGTMTNRYTPVDVVGLSSGAVAISLGSDHSCALMASGGIKCWGSNGSGDLGNGTTGGFSTTPVDVTGFTDGMTIPVNPTMGMSSLSCYYHHCCAVNTSGGLKCWGDGDNIPVEVEGLSSGVVGVSCGNEHACAVMASGGVKCWGSNANGQIGIGEVNGGYFATPMDVEGLSSGVSAVSSGSVFSCALIYSGEVKCWGRNIYGELGIGTHTGPEYCNSIATNYCGTTPLGGINSFLITSDIEPPQGLILTPLEGGLAQLDWLKSPSAEVTGYEVFSDNRTGAIDYSSPLAVINDPQAQTWTSGVLAEGRYCFAVRATADNQCPVVVVPAIVCGDVYGTVPCASGDPSAEIKIPKAGKRLNGNRTLIFAEVTDRCGGTAEVGKVLFQYRPEGGIWTTVTDANPYHPNPDERAPYFVHWDVTGLADGDYYLRAVAYNYLSVPDPEPSEILVTIDQSEPQEVEQTCSSGCIKEKKEHVYQGRDNEIVAGNNDADCWDGILIPEGAMTGVTDTVILTLENPEDHSGKCPANKICDAGEYRTINFISGQHCLESGLTAQVKFSYADDNQDGIVDGTGIAENSLKAYKWVSGTEWLEIPCTVDVVNNQVVFEMGCFSLFGLFSGQSSSEGSGGAGDGGGGCGGNVNLWEMLAGWAGFAFLRKQKRNK